MNKRATAGNDRQDSAGSDGSVVVPFLVMLSLLSLLAVSAIKVGGLGNSASEALVGRSQARMAAHSGVEIAYRRLAANPDYTGEICTPFRDSSCSIDISVTDLGNREFEVLSRGIDGQSECTVRTRTHAAEYVVRYPLCVGGDLELQGESGVLGDVYVENRINGTAPAVISGNVYLEGDRTLMSDLAGNIIFIDGADAPRIDGEAYANAPGVVFPSVNMSVLYDMAFAADQVYSGSVVFEDRTFEGVVYIEGSGSSPCFADVVIKGLLVCDGVSEIRVENGLLKIHADENICPNTAVLAPDSGLMVATDGFMDIHGLSYFESVDFQGGGTFTGPVVVLTDLTSLPSSYFFCQFPSSMSEFSSSGISWSESIMVELKYAEL